MIYLNQSDFSLFSWSIILVFIQIPSGISSERKRQNPGGRGSGKAMGKPRRSRQTSVMERYEMDAPNILALWERRHICWFSHIENEYLKDLTTALNIYDVCLRLCIS